MLDPIRWGSPLEGSMADKQPLQVVAGTAHVSPWLAERQDWRLSSQIDQIEALSHCTTASISILCWHYLAPHILHRHQRSHEVDLDFLLHVSHPAMLPQNWWFQKICWGSIAHFSCFFHSLSICCCYSIPRSLLDLNPNFVRFSLFVTDQDSVSVIPSILPLSCVGSRSPHSPASW